MPVAEDPHLGRFGASDESRLGFPAWLEILLMHLLCIEDLDPLDKVLGVHGVSGVAHTHLNGIGIHFHADCVLLRVAQRPGRKQRHRLAATDRLAGPGVKNLRDDPTDTALVDFLSLDGHRRRVL